MIWFIPNLYEYILNLFEKMHTAGLQHTCRAYCRTAGHSRVRSAAHYAAHCMHPNAAHHTPHASHRAQSHNAINMN
jgi:hypothetical protein